jgi:hypothetical protein
VNKITIVAIATLAAFALLVPTGAVPIDAFEAFGSDEIPDAEIELAPADGPNGGYAVLNEDDEIELLLTESNPFVEGGGVLDNAVTPLDRVFTITYTGDQYAEVWITDDVADVEFYHGDDRTSLERRANNVTLAPNATVTVGLLVDTRGDDDVENASQFTVHARFAEAEPEDEPPDSAGSGGGDGFESDAGDGSGSDDEPADVADDGPGSGGESDDGATDGGTGDAETDTASGAGGGSPAVSGATAPTTTTVPPQTGGDTTTTDSETPESLFEQAGIAGQILLALALLILVLLAIAALRRRRRE